jgi:tRNA nucleotidyltransferase (CCA-adding enzyme)
LGLDEMWVLLIYCLQIDSKDIEKFLRRWKLPIKKMRQIQSIHHWTVYRLGQEWNITTLYLAGKENIRHAESLYNTISKHQSNNSIGKWVELYENLPIKSRTEITISGNDLMEIMNRPAGPWIKECLELIEKTILEGKLDNQSEKIREWVLGCNLK